MLPVGLLDLVQNAFMDGAGTTATRWQVIGSATTTLLPAIELTPGNWQQLAGSGIAAGQLRQLDLACPPEWIGKKVKAAIEIQFDAGTTLANINLRCDDLKSDQSLNMASADILKYAGEAGACDPTLLVSAGYVVLETTTATVKPGTATIQFILELAGLTGAIRARRTILTLA